MAQAPVPPPEPKMNYPDMVIQGKEQKALIDTLEVGQTFKAMVTFRVVTKSETKESSKNYNPDNCRAELEAIDIEPEDKAEADAEDQGEPQDEAGAAADDYFNPSGGDHGE